jgi:hypothetical protein
MQAARREPSASTPQSSLLTEKLLEVVVRPGLQGVCQRDDMELWSRKASTGDASVVVAMTLALAVGSEIEVEHGAAVIY